MEIVGVIMALLGILGACVGWLWLTILLFKENRMMGYSSMFCFPALSLVVILTNWDDAKIPFFILLGAGGLAFGGVWLAEG